jgi:FAD:protein FMN transferase
MKPFLDKSKLYPLILLLLIFIVYKYREGNNEKKVVINGTTMGTTYAIKYLHKEGLNFQASIDSLLEVFNQSMSTYIPDSEISLFNKNSDFEFRLPYFYPVLEKSQEVYEATGGAFDPTIMPLVNAWGFGPSKERVPDSSTVLYLLQLVNFKNIVFNDKVVKKTMPGAMLDFSAIAKGYGVDVIADFLASKDVKNMMVEIGGEVVCRGVNESGNLWTIGIDKPDLEQRSFQAIVKLENKAVATSGNYRNFYVKDGKKYAHTLSPVTGFPVEHSLLSASVFSKDCMTADAYATAFMVMGLEKAKEVLEKHKELDAFLIYADENGQYKTFTTEGLKPFVKE